MEEAERYPAPVRGLAVASAGMGFFSMCVYWWFPFGLCLAAAALTLGAVSLIFGIRGRLEHEDVPNLNLLGAAFGMSALTVGLSVYRLFHVLMTDYITPPQF